jgi:DnaJ-class molecular chaperone
MKKDYFETLGVTPKDNVDTIRKAFWAISRICHPDTNKNPDAVRRFQEASEAYECLANPVKRQAYEAGFNTRTHNLRATVTEVVKGYSEKIKKKQKD